MDQVIHSLQMMYVDEAYLSPHRLLLASSSHSTNPLGLCSYATKKKKFKPLVCGSRNTSPPSLISGLVLTNRGFMPLKSAVAPEAKLSVPSVHVPLAMASLNRVALETAHAVFHSVRCI